MIVRVGELQLSCPAVVTTVGHGNPSVGHPVCIRGTVSAYEAYSCSISKVRDISLECFPIS